MMNESEVLLDVAVLGEQVDQFLKGDVGRFLMDHIFQEINAGVVALKNADCNDPKAVWEAQARVKVAESMEGWLREALMAGLKAREILEDRED